LRIFIFAVSMLTVGFVLGAAAYRDSPISNHMLTCMLVGAMALHVLFLIDVFIRNHE
jgi:hypothetical protein